MKKVVSADLVAHLWANQIQNEARTPTNNFYFYGDTIYSYGSHFVIAKHVTNEAGQNAALFSTRGYSNTTAKQQSITRYASRHLNTILVPDAGENREYNFSRWYMDMREQADKLKTARKPEIYLNQIRYLFEQVKKYTDFFGYTISSDIQFLSELTSKDQLAELSERERIAREQREQEAERKRKEAVKKRLADFKKALKKFRAFAPGIVRIYDNPTGFDYLRFNAETNRVETSQRIEIPAEIAKRFYNQVLATIESGGCVDCGIYLMEHYQVKEINKKYIIVGCHKIEIKEIKALTNKLGW